MVKAFANAATYLALQPGIEIPPDALPFLKRIYRDSIAGSALFWYESQFATAILRGDDVEKGAVELEQELALFKFLERLDPARYYLKRSGVFSGIRGLWDHHPFLQNALVVAIDAEFSEEYSAYPDSNQRTTEVPVARSESFSEERINRSLDDLLRRLEPTFLAATDPDVVADDFGTLCAQLAQSVRRDASYN